MFATLTRILAMRRLAGPAMLGIIAGSGTLSVASESAGWL